MHASKKLTKLENEIMSVIWAKQDISGAEITYELKDSLGVSRATVKEYIKRLSAKGFVGIHKISPRIHRYYPLISDEEYLATDVSVFLENHKRGLSNLIASLIRDNKISNKELDEIELIIKESRQKE